MIKRKFILVFLIIVFCLPLFGFTFNNKGYMARDCIDSIDKNSPNDNDVKHSILTYEEIYMAIKKTEYEFKNKGIDVHNELMKIKEKYNYLNISSSSKKKNIFDEFINVYDNYKNNPSINTKMSDEKAALMALYDMLLVTLEAAGYELTVELLIHAVDNGELNSCYKPQNKNVLRNTTEYSNKLGGDVAPLGSSEFSGEIDTIYEKDSHYAINKYRYHKTSNNSGFVITDRYDYEDKDYEKFIVGVANNFMYTMQIKGLIIPYFVVIEFSELYSPRVISNEIINFNSKSTYFEKVGIIGRGDSLEYTFFVDANVNKTIQTFGPNDTIIELYEKDGTFVAYDDNSGYENNACICPYLTTNKEYRLLVHMKTNQEVGNIRIGFCSSVSPFYSDIELIKESGFFTKKFEKKDVHAYWYLSNLFKIKRTQDKSITMKTTEKNNLYSDTFLYIIDPRRSDYYANGNTSDNPPLYIYDDDSDGNLQARLNIPTYFLPKYVEFIVVSSLYDLNKSGDYTLVTEYNEY